MPKVQIITPSTRWPIWPTPDQVFVAKLRFQKSPKIEAKINENHNIVKSGPNVQIFRFHNHFENYMTANVLKYENNEFEGLKLPSIFHKTKWETIF